MPQLLDRSYTVDRTVPGDEPGLDEADDERPGTNEAVKDVDALVGETLTEVLTKRPVGRAEDEVDDLDQGVDDAELVHGLLERGGEERVVQAHDDLLPALGGVQACHLHTHRVVELLQGVVLVIKGVLVEHGEHLLHRLGDRVVFGEVVAAEQGVEHRSGDEVLGQHLDCVGFGDAVVEVPAQASDELVERGPHVGVRVLQECFDAGDVGLGDGGHVLGPVLPVGLGADLGNDLGEDCVAEFVDVPPQLH